MGILTPWRQFSQPSIILPSYGTGLSPAVDVTPITVSGLTATPGLGQVVLAWSYTDLSGVIAVIEVWASRTNDRTAAAHFGDAGTPANPSLVTFTHIVGPLGSSLYYWIRARDVSGNECPWSSAAGAGVQATANNIPSIPGLSYSLQNGTISYTVASNALTVAIKTLSGNDPSKSDPVFCSFKTSSGAYSTLPIAAALSLTISQGSTLGTDGGVSNFGFRLWLIALNVGGVVELALGNRASPGSTLQYTILSLSEFGVITTVAEGGSGGADGFSFYSTAARIDAPFRVLGFLEWSPMGPSGLYTSGNWSAPNKVELYTRGTPLPGDTVQSADVFLSAASASTTIPLDNTVPQITEGSEIIAPSFTPRSDINFIDISVPLMVTADGARHVIAAVFTVGYANAMSAVAAYVPAANSISMMTLQNRHKACDSQTNFATGARSYSVRVGGESAGLWYVNNTPPASVLFGSFANATKMSVKELMI